MSRDFSNTQSRELAAEGWGRPYVNRRRSGAATCRDSAPEARERAVGGAGLSRVRALGIAVLALVTLPIWRGAYAVRSLFARQ
jgi:hypothetical protein